MPKISSYTTTAPALTDKLIGTDTNDSSATKNFTVEDVLGLVNPNSFNLVLESSELLANSPQTATAINTATKITLGGVVSGADVNLAADGDLTFSTEGKYYVQLLVNSGSVATYSGSAVASIYFNSYKNDVEYGIAIQDSLALIDSQPPTTEGLSINIIFDAVVDDVLSFKFSVNDLIMGLKHQGSTLGNVISANIKIYKI